jgi:hypothetical protein
LSRLDRGDGEQVGGPRHCSNSSTGGTSYCKCYCKTCGNSPYLQPPRRNEGKEKAM